MAEHTPLSDEEFVTKVTAIQLEMRAFILGLAPKDGDADDILQETNLALWRKRELYAPDKDFLKWAFGFAFLEVRRFHSRASNRRVWFSEETINLLAEEWQHADTFLDDCRDALSNCLGKLGENERKVIDARFGGRQSVKQIAEDSGRPSSTVYKILTRALKSLRSCIQQQRLHS